MEIWDLFFRNGLDREVVSFIGTGGKTSMMRLFAEHYRRDLKVLVTGTVDMERIPEEELDFIDYDYTESYSLHSKRENGVYLLSSRMTNNNMLMGIPLEDADEITPSFDLSLVECDISRKRPFKAWRDNEPLIPMSTTVTFSMLDITALGKEVSVENLHNLDVFMDMTGKSSVDIIEVEDLVLFLSGAESIYRRTQSRTILFINKVEDEESERNALALAKKLNHFGPDVIMAGSVKKREYRFLKFSSPL